MTVGEQRDSEGREDGVSGKGVLLTEGREMEKLDSDECDTGADSVEAGGGTEEGTDKGHENSCGF